MRFFFSSRRRHTILQGDWSSDVCSSDLGLDSYGHDVETAYLLLESAHALGVRNHMKNHTSRMLLDHALDHGWDKAGGGFFEEIGRASCREGVQMVEEDGAQQVRGDG